VPEYDLPVLKINVSVLNIADGGSAAAGVHQVIDNHPISVFAEVAIPFGLFKKNGKFFVGIGFLDGVLLFDVWNADIRKPLSLTPFEEGIEYA
jgi:hypothetical protein